MNKDISFVVIGKNEGWKLNKCFDSIDKLIDNNNHLTFEVIYVDSNSTDNSIENAKKRNNTKIFNITAAANAAIARNIGALESSGNILFFVDGDMELNPDFLKYALNGKNLRYDCLTGHLDDKLYDLNWNCIDVRKRTYKISLPNKELILKTNGGIFLIKKEVWQCVSGMRTKYKRSQDIDLTIRLNKKGYQTVRLPFMIAIHNTISYNSENRMWWNLKKCYIFYNAMIFREHFSNFFILLKTAKSNYTALILLLTFMFTIMSEQIAIYCAFVYGILLLFKVSKITKNVKIIKNKFFYFFEKIIFQFCEDFLFWFGFFLFYPKNIQLSYKKIL